jgi:hypothetical protein
MPNEVEVTSLNPPSPFPCVDMSKKKKIDVVPLKGNDIVLVTSFWVVSQNPLKPISTWPKVEAYSLKVNHACPNPKSQGPSGLDPING